MFRRALAFTLLLAPSALRAADAPPPPAGPEVTDQAIDELKAKAKEALLKKTSEIEKTHADREAFAKALKDDRVAFEKKTSDELMAFLTLLKSVPSADRRKALADFYDKQRNAREDFNRQSRARIEEFRRRNTD